MRTCILILGMHRSGTSSVAGTLSELGVYFGNNLMPALPENPKGFYENWDLYLINEEILKRLNTSWSNIKYIPNDSFDDDYVKHLRNKIKYIIKNDLMNRDIFAIKDPRLCLLYPVYYQILSELQIQIVNLYVYRESLEIAYSLKKRNSFSIKFGLALTYYYLWSLKKHVNLYNLKKIEFSAFIENPEAEIKSVLPELINSGNKIKFPEKKLKSSYKISFIKKIYYKLIGFILFKIKLCY